FTLALMQCMLLFCVYVPLLALPSFPTRRSSDLHRGQDRARYRGGRQRARGWNAGAWHQDYVLGPKGKVHPRARGVPGPACAVAQDRKSTRLNSSHVSISYAVFCLKKKNRMTIRR